MSRPLVLIIDDDQRFVSRLKDALEGMFRVEAYLSEEEFRERFVVGQYDLLIMDMRLRQNREGLELLQEALARDPTQQAIVMTAYADTASYGEAIAAGAMTYLDKREFSPALIARTVEAIVQQGVLQRRLMAMERRLEAAESRELIGISPGIKEVGEAVRRAAEDGFAPVLIVGEPGSGRKLAARKMHLLSRRRSHGPFLLAPCDQTNVGAAGVSLFGRSQDLEGRLAQDSKGLMDEAKGGVLYIDGVESLGHEAAKGLAEAIESGSYERVGGTKSIDAEVQFAISVRPEDGGTEVPTQVRNALERAGVITIHVPPLRDRVEDIPLIAQYTLQRLFRSGQSRARSFRGAALELLEAHDWPGNVRELCCAVEYAAARVDAVNGREVGPEHLPLGYHPPGALSDGSAKFDYKRHLAWAECDLIERACGQHELGTQMAVAKVLGYNDRYTFARRIRKHLAAYPVLVAEFPCTAALFEEGRQRNAS